MSRAGPEIKRLRKLLTEISDRAFQQHIDWMHFHEVAIADPFAAETEAQAFAADIARLAALDRQAGSHDNQETK